MATDFVANVELKYEEIIKDYKGEVLVDSVLEAPTDFFADSV